MRTIAILQQIDCGNCQAVAFDPPDQLERQIALEHAAGHGDGDVAAGCAPVCRGRALPARRLLERDRRFCPRFVERRR